MTLRLVKGTSTGTESTGTGGTVPVLTVCGRAIDLSTVQYAGFWDAHDLAHAAGWDAGVAAGVRLGKAFDLGAAEAEYSTVLSALLLSSEGGH